MTYSIYVSGPIMAPGSNGGLPLTSEVDDRKRKFNQVSAKLRGNGEADGLLVINPLDIKPCGPITTNPHYHAGKPTCDATIYGDQDHSWQCYLRYDLEVLVMCHEVVMLPGWEGSPGANVEKSVAEMLGLDISYWCDRCERTESDGPCQPTKDDKECQGV